MRRAHSVSTDLHKKSLLPDFFFCCFPSCAATPVPHSMLLWRVPEHPEDNSQRGKVEKSPSMGDIPLVENSMLTWKIRI